MLKTSAFQIFHDVNSTVINVNQKNKADQTVKGIRIILSNISKDTAFLHQCDQTVLSVLLFLVCI